MINQLPYRSTVLHCPEAEQIPMELYQPTTGQNYQVHPEPTLQTPAQLPHP